jgi:hypothetical protein
MGMEFMKIMWSWNLRKSCGRGIYENHVVMEFMKIIHTAPLIKYIKI